VLIGEDGFVTLAALKWLSDQDISFLTLERNGKPLCVTGPARPSEAKLRRAQALAISNGVGLEICRQLIEAKLKGQEQVLREFLYREQTARLVASLRDKLPAAQNLEAIRGIEAHAASYYFGEWRDLPLTWPKADLQRVPAHWRTVGSRQSPLTGGPRLAVTPVHAILNYCFALLESETRLALASLGLDPGLGVGLHTDTANRDSLALDVLEPVRPQVERWLLHWIASEPLRKADFFETGNGNCRLRSQICSKLGETAPVWGELVAPWAEYVGRAIWASKPRSSTLLGDSVPPTRLTQRRRTEAKGRVWRPVVADPQVDHLCMGCGKPISAEHTNCAHCAVEAASKRLIKSARAGRMAAYSSKARAKRADTQRRNALAQHAWKESQQPAWLTDQVYSQRIQPQLAKISSSKIASAIGVTRCYAGNIRKGRFCPHPRHWQVLAKVAGLSGK
jgi:CRISPR-associated endonuclease Cas1